jgi:hypothetical protein
MAAFFDFLFGRKRSAPITNYESLYPERSEPSRIKKPRHPNKTKTIRLPEREFDPDGNQSDLMWYGFVIWDDRGVAIPFDEISERVHSSVRIFKVAGTSHRLEALQTSSFEPGKMLMLKLEDNNQYDRNAVSVWNENGQTMVGYVPRDLNATIRAILQLSPESKAMVLAQMRKDGQRVSLQVLFGPIVSNELIRE